METFTVSHNFLPMPFFFFLFVFLSVSFISSIHSQFKETNSLFSSLLLLPSSSPLRRFSTKCHIRFCPCNNTESFSLKSTGLAWSYKIKLLIHALIHNKCVCISPPFLSIWGTVRLFIIKVMHSLHMGIKFKLFEVRNICHRFELLLRYYRLICDRQYAPTAWNFVDVTSHIDA